MLDVVEETPDGEEWLTWYAHHASIQQGVMQSPTTAALLPLFMESAHSVAMIKHSIHITRSLTQHLNPGHTPILAPVHTLYALAMEIQWNWPMTH